MPILTPGGQPSSPPDSAPDIIRVPEINEPGASDITVDCPVEMPAREA